MSGCAIHPLPEDVTGLTTGDIVKQIRCESRDAARKIIIRELERLANFGNNARAAELLAAFSADPEAIDGFNPDAAFPGLSNTQVRNFFKIVYSTAIAYSFDLTMSETNNLGITANLLGPWANMFTMGLTGDGNRSRENDRIFTITDRFGFLLRNLNTLKVASGSRYCDGRIVGPNYIYPIAGQIGVYNTVYTFFELSLFENLAAKGTAGPSAPLVDQLTFTTTFDITATPKVVFSSVNPSNFRVTDAGATGMLSRMDTHKVTVGLAMEPAGSAALSSLSGFVFSGAGTSGPLFAAGRPQTTFKLNRVIGTAASQAELLALYAVDQVKSREVQLLPPPR
jgi:hypothetical protein